mmetsp:Transcript_121692/g.190936  ORF Transcript_121692/g.190936 Transcript_121692/m.190936 type:complete len:185 (+) Transcript_121692:121-675(+)
MILCSRTLSSVWMMQGFLILLTSAWPHYMLERNCELGVALVDRNSKLPIIMNARPFENPALLSVSVGVDSDIVESGAQLQVGVPVTLKYNGTFSIDGTHIAFVVSSGQFPNSLPCGASGAKMICTTCDNTGSKTGFLRHASWTPGPEVGEARLAVTMAHVGKGTPSVVVGRLTVQVVAGPDSDL